MRAKVSLTLKSLVQPAKAMTLSFVLLHQGGCSPDMQVNEEPPLVTQTLEIPTTSQVAQAGYGVDTLTGAPRGACVDIEGVPTSTSTGKEVTLELNKIETTEELKKVMEASASAQYGGMVNGKGKFAEERKIDSYGVNLLVKSRVTNSAVEALKVKLKPEAKALLSLGDGGKTFRERCGDEYVSGAVLGGEYYALIQVRTRNETHKQNISAKVGGSYGAFSASAKFKKDLEEISKDTQIDAYFFRRNGDTNAVGTTIEAALAEAANLPNTTTGTNSWQYKTLTRPYNQLLDYPTGATIVDTQIQAQAISQLAARREAMLSLSASIDYILKNPGEFQATASALQELSGRQNTIATRFNKLTAAATACYNSYQSCSLPTDLPEVSTILPTRLGGTIHDAVKDPSRIFIKRGTGLLVASKRYGLVCQILTPEQFSDLGGNNSNLIHMNFAGASTMTSELSALVGTPVKVTGVCPLPVRFYRSNTWSAVYKVLGATYCDIDGNAFINAGHSWSSIRWTLEGHDPIFYGSLTYTGFCTNDEMNSL